jgi:hypothetical protein
VEKPTKLRTLHISSGETQREGHATFRMDKLNKLRALHISSGTTKQVKDTPDFQWNNQQSQGHFQFPVDNQQTQCNNRKQ